MGSCCGCCSVDDENEELQALNNDDEGSEISISIESENDVDEEAPEVFYVIVGRGPMAVVNHRTLIESNSVRAQLLQAHTVMHVGFPNPWPRYLLHGLGQPNHLLSLPAFGNQPSIGGAVIDGGLSSQHFGGQIDAEYATIDPAPAEAEEWVALIQGREVDRRGALDAVNIAAEIGGGDVRDRINLCLNDVAWTAEAPYRLCLYDPQDGTARWVYAVAIDICTGPGRPQVLAPADGDSDPVRRARTPPWLTPERWQDEAEWINRRTMNGVDAIRDEVVWAGAERVCVTAGGGVGLNAAEKARNNGCVLDWFGRTGLMNPIFNNPRNITYLRCPNSDDPCQPGPRADAGITDEDHLIASSNRARMGRGAVLHSVANDDDADPVEVRLAVTPGNNVITRIRDWWRNRSDLNAGENRWTLSQDYSNVVGPLNVAESRLYHRLVIPNGQQTDQVGQPFRFANHLGFQPVVAAGRMVALATADGFVRLIGAACNNYPGNDFVRWTANHAGVPPEADAMWTFHATLPVSAVTDGFIICSVNTALANGYFTTHPNRNVNTMTLDELTAVVGGGRAGQLIAARNARNGYAAIGDLVAVCGADPSLANLTFSY